MHFIELVFWAALFLIFYTYIGYGLVIYAMIRIKRLFKKSPQVKGNYDDLPEVSFVVAAYNEADFIEQKVKNSLNLDYPADKIKYMFVTDGSSDGTPNVLGKYPEIQVFHRNARRGKIAAINRVMQYVTSPIVIFSDANTDLNKEAILEIVKHYQNPKVGGVAGEKRIFQAKQAQASEAGEGLYWKYESFLKKMDSELSSVMGAAGELFSLRTELYQEVERNAILDDFMISFRIIKRGYKLVYEPDAYAQESSTVSVKEELKRKIRISAGGLQSILWLRDLLNPFKYGLVSFQYLSHRVLRWTLAPLCLAIVLLCNLTLAIQSGGVYEILLYLQMSFYVAALIGWVLENKKVKIKAFFIPYYFLMMNYSVYVGCYRIFRGKQSVLWEKVKRAELDVNYSQLKSYQDPTN